MDQVDFIPTAPSPFSEREFEVRFFNRHLFNIGFKRQCLTTNRVYVTLEPKEGLKTLTHTDVRILRTALDANFNKCVLFAEVELKNKAAVKFARLFGFVPIEVYRDRILMERH